MSAALCGTTDERWRFLDVILQQPASQMPHLSQRKVVSKPWGRTDVGAFAQNLKVAGEERDPVGEIWFDPGPGDVMVKYLFTSDRLSIQLHPNDVEAARMGEKRGKEECWLILDADENANYGIGFREPLSRADIKRSALDGSILDKIDWRPALAGDFIYNPAGTVHALGPGLTVLEVQQNSDVTLRLFDYFRDRPLHLDEALPLARLERHSHVLDTHIDFEHSRILVAGPKFGLAFCRGSIPAIPVNARNFQLVTWEQAIRVDGILVPPGSAVRNVSLSQVDARRGERFFLVWSLH